jgi:hypothetical protein
MNQQLHQKGTSAQEAALQSHQAPAGQSLSSALAMPRKTYAVVAVTTTQGPNLVAASTDQTAKTVEPTLMRRWLT